MGGHCLPVDPFYLTWKAREYDISTEFIELAGKVNQQMPYYCLEKAERALNDAGKPVRGSRILVLGVAYKAGVGDMRESPALKILRLLRDRGADVAYHDPHVPELPELGLRSAELPAAADDADLALIVTAHPPWTTARSPRPRRSRSTCVASPATWARPHCSSDQICAARTARAASVTRGRLLGGQHRAHGDRQVGAGQLVGDGQLDALRQLAQRRLAVQRDAVVGA